ncbi:flagellar basal body rod protein FlgF [Aliidiomarina sanyensis]|uniref:Flagellar basal-body rod protein FlgF n=1 Tax=Aliidiomarina sanyensis TaxID=1249555 RepID=A0A432WPV6_9GAMM|nr:flagellar basal body rod protein FlgF [Aliidiomarina sanyensis]RUO35836.1 flagellar biosynthesis protein FlgF [Aliidiomarina sanyensis]
MDPILYTAMGGARQTLDDQAVINHNLANVSTSGFRAQLSAVRAVPMEGPGVFDTRTAVVGSTPLFDQQAGPINTTGRPLDVALRGDAWLAVQAADGSEAYTRRGDLNIDETGVLTSNGRPVLGAGGPIVIPLGAEITIGEDGTLTMKAEGARPTEIAEIDRLKMVSGDAAVLQRGLDGLFRGVNGPLPQNEDARLASGALEGSNVSAVEAMVAMINNQRKYDMQMKVISTADENAQRANSLLSVQG